MAVSAPKYGGANGSGPACRSSLEFGYVLGRACDSENSCLDCTQHGYAYAASYFELRISTALNLQHSAKERVPVDEVS